jgi:hypothetical protein
MLMIIVALKSVKLTLIRRHERLRSDTDGVPEILRLR